MSDKKYLQLRGSIWWLVKRIPAKLKERYENKELLRVSLETSNLKDARRRRDVIIAQLHEQEMRIEEAEKPRERFRRLVEDMEAVFENHDSDELSDICSPTLKQEKDPVYVNAYRHVSTEQQVVPAIYGYTLKDALQGYIEHHGSADSDSILNGTRAGVDALLSLTGKEDMPLVQLNRKLTIKFVQETMSISKYPTLRTHLAGLRRIMKYATAIGEYTGPDHFRDIESLVPKSAKVNKSYQPLTDEMVINLLNAGEPGTWQHRIPRILAFTGCRIDELASLRIEDVKTTDGGVMYLDIPKGKTESASRVVPVHDLIKPLLQDQLEQAQEAVRKRLVAEGTTPLWWDIETKRTRGAIMSNWLSLKKEKLFGTKERCYSWHSLRVMVASALEELGVPEMEAAKLLGHKTGKTMSYGLYSKTQNMEVLKGHVEKLHSAPTLTGIAEALQPSQ